jgi:rSAM/selenodomain-associated transferase 1
VIVFAKAPRPGHAKTRLIPALGEQGAAQLAERLLQLTLEHALGAGTGPVELCVTPDRHHRAFAAASSLHALAITEQGDGDLGQRMARALERSLATQPRALLIGTDAPGLDAAYLRDAARALDHADAVFGPAADGGYALVGLKQPVPELFAAMRWSHARVMADTRQRIIDLGLRHVELAVLHDVDEPADLVHLPDSLRS